MTPALAVALGTVRSGRTHLARALGSRLAALAVLATVLVLAIGLNVAVFAFMDSSLSALVDPTGPLPDDERKRILASVVQSQMLTGAGFALLLVTLVPGKSALGLSARIAGASRVAVSVGELLPTIVASVVVTVSVQSGVFVFVSQGQLGGAWTLSTLYLLGAAYGLAALFVKGVFEGVGRLVRLGDDGRRVFAIITSVGLLGLGLAEMLATSLSGQIPTVVRVSDVLWHGQPLPSSGADFVISLLALVVVLALLLGVQLLGGNDAPIAVASRIILVPPAAHPRRFGSFVIREIVLFVRHPLSQVMFLTLLVFGTLLILGAKASWFPPPIAAYLVAFLFASGLEVSFGRTSPFHWMYASARFSMHRVMIAKYLAGIAVQGTLFVVALVVLFPEPALLEMATSLLPTFFALCSVALLGGTLLPYSDTAAVGISLTSLVVIVLEVGVLLLDSWVLQGQPLLQVPVNLLVMVGAVALSMFIAAQRSPT